MSGIGWGGILWGGGPWAGPEFIMASFQNLSFEDAGVGSGMADAWAYNWLADAQAIAGYDTTGQSREDFEEEWNSNEGYLFVLAGTAASYVTDNPTPKLFENFDEHWSSNQNYVFGFSGAAAVYGVDNFDGFETAWDNSSYVFAFVGPGTDLTVAAYTSDGSFESFETGWTDPYLYAFVGVGTDLTAYMFDSGANAFESFEGTWTAMTTI